MLSPIKPPTWKIAAVLVVGVLSVSTSAVLIRLTLTAAGSRAVGFSLVLAAARLGIAAIALLPTWWSLRPSAAQPNAWRFSVAAGLFLAVHFATWITSLSYTSVAASTALVTTNPVWVALLSWRWFGEKPSTQTTLGIAIALCGSLAISFLSGDSQSSTSPLLGNGLALVGSWAVSFYLLLGRTAQQQGLTIRHHIVLTYTTAALILLPLPWFWNTAYTGYSLAVYGYMALMALFPQLIGHTSFNWAIRWVSPTLVTLSILAEPVGSSILAFLVFGENPGLGVMVAALVVLLGVAIAALGSTQPSPNS